MGYTNFASDFRSFATVRLTGSDIAQARDFVNEVLKVKLQEDEHKRDGDQEMKRWMTGRLGEMGLETFLGASFTDWSVGLSWKYDVSDLGRIGVSAGVKTASWGNYPTVPQDPRHKEVILVLEGTDVHICGLAKQSVMMMYSDDNLIMNPKLRAKGTKTGFYGFSELLRFDDLEELRRLSFDPSY